MKMKMLVAFAVVFVSTLSLSAQVSGAQYIMVGDALRTRTLFAIVPGAGGQTVPATQWVIEEHDVDSPGAQPADLEIYYTVQNDNALTTSNCNHQFNRVVKDQARALANPKATAWPYLQIVRPNPNTQILTVDTDGNAIVLLDGNQFQCNELWDFFPPGNGFVQ